MSNTQRLRRVADQIQRELSEVLRDQLKDPRVGMVTLTGVDVSPDLAHAKIYYTMLGNDTDRTQTEEGLLRAAGFLRAMLGHRLRMRTVPELRFLFDVSIERGMRLSQLIDQAVSGQKPGS